jgi:hypothetical protein
MGIFGEASTYFGVVETNYVEKKEATLVGILQLHCGIHTITASPGIQGSGS